MQRVYKQGEPAFLKVAMHAEERRGSALVRWWNGEGAVRVLAHSDTAMLLECACGGQSLANLSQTGHDAEASRIICKVVTRLHAHTGANPPELMPLSQCFTALASAASAQELARTRFYQTNPCSHWRIRTLHRNTIAQSTKTYGKPLRCVLGVVPYCQTSVPMS